MRVIQERDGGNAPLVAYTWGQDLSGSFEGAGGIGGLLGRSDQYSAGSWGRHVSAHADGNGNVTALSDSNQAIVGSYRYDPYGQVLAQSGALASANKIRFSTKLWFDSINIYYYGYRFYDPGLQRWLNRDPIGELGGINLYRYVKNDPIRRIDALGLEDSELLRPDSPPPIARPRRRATEQWPFKYYQPGSEEENYGDWVPSDCLDNCISLAHDRNLRRTLRGVTRKVPTACLPGYVPYAGKVIDGLHVILLGKFGAMMDESQSVLELDIWACYQWWDAPNTPPRYQWPNLRLPVLRSP
jgi:RHS repeat-associated protein